MLRARDLTHVSVKSDAFPWKPLKARELGGYCRGYDIESGNVKSKNTYRGRREMDLG